MPETHKIGTRNKLIWFCGWSHLYPHPHQGTSALCLTQWNFVSTASKNSWMSQPIIKKIIELHHPIMTRSYIASTRLVLWNLKYKCQTPEYTQNLYTTRSFIKANHIRKNNRIKLALAQVCTLWAESFLVSSIVFTQGPIFGFFTLQGRHVAPTPNFTLIGSGVWVYGPKNFKNLEYYQYNCPKGRFPCTNSYKIYRVYARPQST